MVKIKAEESSPSRRPAEALTNDVMEFIQFPVFLNAQIVACTKLLHTGCVARRVVANLSHVLIRFEMFSNGCLSFYTLRLRITLRVRRSRSRKETVFHH